MIRLEVGQQVFFDARTDAVIKKDPVRRGDGGAPRLRRAAQLAHDQLHKEQRRFRRLFVSGKVVEHAEFFFAAERGIGQDDVHALPVADAGKLLAQTVAWIDLRRFQHVFINSARWRAAGTDWVIALRRDQTGLRLRGWNNLPNCPTHELRTGLTNRRCDPRRTPSTSSAVHLKVGGHQSMRCLL